MIVRNCVIANNRAGFYHTTGQTNIWFQHNCWSGVHTPWYNYSTDETLWTMDEINNQAGCFSNFVAVPGFADLANNHNFNSLYENSPLLNTGIGGVDIGPHQDPPEVAVSNLTYYVSLSGADANDGRSWGNSWLTVGKAATVAAAGDTVVISNGTFNESVTITKGGSGDSPVIYRAAEGSTPVIDGTGSDAIRFSYVGGVVLDGLDLTSATYGLYLLNSCVGTITNCRAYSNFSYGMYDYGCNNGFSISDSEFYSNSGYGMRSGSRGGWTLERCEIYGNTSYGFYGGIHQWIAFYNCLIYSNAIDGVYLSQGSPNQGGSFRNCTIYGNGGDGFDLSNNYGYDIKNCIIARNGGFGLYDNTANDGVAQHNCFFENNQNYAAPYTNVYEVWQNGGTHTNLAVTESDINENGSPGITNNIVSDPLFVDTAANDYQLQSTSPCIDAGTTLIVPADYSLDFSAKLRLKGSSIDIGAYEWQPPAGTLFVIR